MNEHAHSLAQKQCRRRVLWAGSFGGRTADVEPPWMDSRRLPAQSTRRRHGIGVLGALSVLNSLNPIRHDQAQLPHKFADWA